MSGDEQAGGAPALSKVEYLKLENDGLGGIVFDEMNDLSTDYISEDAYQLLKFHGSYQQDDRDLRQARKKQGLDRAWSFLVRTKFPGGRITSEQYLMCDELATLYGNQTLRITTRQDFQFHGVGKANLKPLIRALNERWMTTYGGCGDVSRNTMTNPVSDLLPGVHYNLQEIAQQISDELMPQSTSYYELWLDGEKILADGQRVQVTPSRQEPFYGQTYLPRKHKIAISTPEDNSVDLYTNDLGLEAIVDEQGYLQGFNLVAGGGLGSTHGKAETFPRLADRICYLTPDQVIPMVKAATMIYRDYGDRTNRRHARLKYVLEERGVAWFQAEMSQRLGFEITPPVPVTTFGVSDYLGWQQQADGRWMVGIFIEHGRIKDSSACNAKTGLRAIIETFKPGVRLTAHQNLVLVNIEEADKPRIAALLAQYGLSVGDSSLSTLRRYAMACPAYPTCGLAVAESERYMPDLISDLERRGYGNERVWIRMSGCPNACSRPPSAEIGLVGRSLGLYNVYAGGSFEGTRLNKLYKANVRSQQLPEVLAEMLEQWRQQREEGEAFGDWSNRTLVANV